MEGPCAFSPRLQRTPNAVVALQRARPPAWHLPSEPVVVLQRLVRRGHGQEGRPAWHPELWGATVLLPSVAPAWTWTGLPHHYQCPLFLYINRVANLDDHHGLSAPLSSRVSPDHESSTPILASPDDPVATTVQTPLPWSTSTWDRPRSMRPRPKSPRERRLTSRRWTGRGNPICGSSTPTPWC